MVFHNLCLMCERNLAKHRAGVSPIAGLVLFDFCQRPFCRTKPFSLSGFCRVNPGSRKFYYSKPGVSNPVVIDFVTILGGMGNVNQKSIAMTNTFKFFENRFTIEIKD